MKRLLLSIGLLLPLVVAARPIEIMVEDAASPWSNPDGTGYANEIVQAAFAAVQADVALSVVPYARCKKYVMAGLVPACLSMSSDPLLRGKVRFAEQPLFLAYPRFYYNTAYPVPARSLAKLPAKLHIGVVNGYEYPPEVARLAARGIGLDEARSDATNLKKLGAGRIGLALTMMDDIKTEAVLLQEAGVVNVALAFELKPQGSYIGFSTAHRDGERARVLFNQGYAIIAANGVKQAIDEKWHVKGPKAK
jgi:polar amino acid transport system substrate-binding protein